MRAARVGRRTTTAAIATLVALLAATAGCTDGGTPGPGPEAPPPAPATVTATPASGDRVAPALRPSVHVESGTLDQVALTGDDGKPLPGTFSPDHRTWTATAAPAFSRGYRWSGTATGADGGQVPVAGGFRTATPGTLRKARFGIADNTTVGVAAPVMLQFDGKIKNKAAVQKALTVATSKTNEGAWAWLPDTADGSRIHYRTRSYWTPGTVVDTKAALYGVDMGDGVYGAEDLTSHLTVGRFQVTKANSKKRQLVVYREGKVVQRAPASFGMGDDLKLVTRNGIHVVSNKQPEAWLSNPAYHYANIYVRWAVRINNNGEFVHFNPMTLDAIGQQNLTHGCINVNEKNSHQFYNSSLVGDPVEVSGGPVNLSASDGDIYDWAIPWKKWVKMSALS
ncbi:L,D-transpeptidase [Pseudonocardia phyllosphaerae]|uniref:L,D-transpeptidase n=1 Tax=Pseudonocardia phyllosphaerae TaxID=3390502 RepID=UPI00397B35E4